MKEQTKCICEQLREDKNKTISLGYDSHTSLMMRYGMIIASGEGGVYEDISYCPYCGKKFE